MRQKTKGRQLTRLAVWFAVASFLAFGGTRIPSANVAVAQEQALAQEQASNDPNAPVSSDGSALSPEAFLSGLQGEEPFEGIGEAAGDTFAEFANRVESAEEVWRLWALPPATGKVGVETIIGPDNRTRVNPTTTYPARAVVLITFTGGRCTGWLYGPDIVATAGHCVHTGGPGGRFWTNVVVYPGRNGAASPFGSCRARRLHTVVGWANSSDERFDYGAIKLNCRVGDATGWFGYFWQAASLTGQRSIIDGYPGDKPLTQWRSLDFIRVSQLRQLFYLNDTVGGMSGSPVYNFRPVGAAFCSNGPCSMAIHTYGLHGAPPHSTNNHGTRITQPVFNNLTAWRNAP